MLEVAVRHRLGDFTLDAAFAAEGGLTALFGRSGSGKTSLVNVIAGLIRPERGRVVVDGEALTDTERGLLRAAEAPPHRLCLSGRAPVPAPDRAAEPALRPLVRARRCEGGRPGEIDHVVELLGIGGLLGAPAGESVGRREAARRDRPGAAGAPAPAGHGRAARRRSTRRARPRSCPISSGCATRPGVPIVYVSHAIAEVARLATTLVVLSEGRVAAVGPTADGHGPHRSVSADRPRRGRRDPRRPASPRTTPRSG